jgi:uncharacterized protein
MRIILDTNILNSALFSQNSLPGKILSQWYDGKYDLLAHAEWLTEIKDVTSRPGRRLNNGR